MATTADRLLSEFIDEWNAGRRPPAAAFVERAPDAEREELAAAISAFLVRGPVPRYSAETLGELMREPAMLATAAALEGRSGLWPSLLPRLRRQARLRRDEVVARLAAALGMEGREERTARYLHELETGTLDARGVSPRVVGALAGILGAARSELEAARGVEGLGGPAAATAWFRSPEAPVESTRRRVPDRPPEERWDELDRLFLGGGGE